MSETTPKKPQTENYLRASGIFKSYSIGRKKIEVLQGVDLTVSKGSWLTLLGASGSGKTTLLNLLGTLEYPDQGHIKLGDADYAKLSSGQSNRFRNHRIGFIFQVSQMLPELTVLENVCLPAMLYGTRAEEYLERATALLDRVGLKHRVKHRPTELSGGEQQRAAIARALINSPELILADEPTGNLDSKTGEGILEIFEQLHAARNGHTIVMITHNQKIAELADEIAVLEDGVVNR